MLGRTWLDVLLEACAQIQPKGKHGQLQVGLISPIWCVSLNLEEISVIKMNELQGLASSFQGLSGKQSSKDDTPWHRQGKVVPTGSKLMAVPPASWLVWKVVQKGSCSLHAAVGSARLLLAVPTMGSPHACAAPTYLLWHRRVPTGVCCSWTPQHGCICYMHQLMVLFQIDSCCCFGRFTATAVGCRYLNSASVTLTSFSLLVFYTGPVGFDTWSMFINLISIILHH